MAAYEPPKNADKGCPGDVECDSIASPWGDELNEQPTSLANGRYLIVEQLGEGGMAAVYRAFDQRLQVWRAIKVLLPQFADKKKILRRFEAEAQTMALLEHRHIVRVYDVGRDGSNIAYIVMELVEGGCLVDWLEHYGPMPARMAVRASQEVCAGLAAAHAKGVIHRDIKPHNVMVTREGICRVTDFGIARVGDSENSQTKTGSVMGTWGYMAPEQRTNTKGVDERGDVYAVGATLYTLLTDRMPMDLFAAERNSSILEGVEEALIPILVKSTEYDREDRYPSVDALAEALEQVYESLPAIPEGMAPLALDAPTAPSPPDPTNFIPATELSEHGQPVHNPTLAPGDTGDTGTETQIGSEQYTLAPVEGSGTPAPAGRDYDPARGPQPGSISAAETVMRMDGDEDGGVPTVIGDPSVQPSQANSVIAGATMAIWLVIGIFLITVLMVVGLWFAVLKPSPEPVPVKPVPEQPRPVEPAPVPPKPVEPVPQPTGPKPVRPHPVPPRPVRPTPVPVVPDPVEPVVPVPPPEPAFIKCVKLASPVSWNSSKTGVIFKFKQCEGDFPSGKRVVLHYRSGGGYISKPLGVASKKWIWKLAKDKIDGKIEWYVDGDMGSIGSAAKPKVFKP